MLHRFCPSLCPGLATLELRRITSDYPIIQQRNIRKETRHSRALKHGRWRLIESLQHSELCSLEENLQAARLVETRHGTARSDDCYMLQRCSAKHWHRVAGRGKKGIGRTSALTTRQSRVLTNTSERRERRDRKGKRFHRRDLVHAECRGSGAPVGSRPHADTGTTVPQISPDGWSAGSGVTNGELCPMPVEGTTSRRN